MIEINISLSDETKVTLTFEQAKELHEKLQQIFGHGRDVFTPAPWIVPFVQPIDTPNVPPASPYITWTTTSGDTASGDSALIRLQGN